jgi:hypothetical protein
MSRRVNATVKIVRNQKRVPAVLIQAGDAAGLPASGVLIFLFGGRDAFFIANLFTAGIVTCYAVGHCATCDGPMILLGMLNTRRARFRVKVAMTLTSTIRVHKSRKQPLARRCGEKDRIHFVLDCKARRGHGYLTCAFLSAYCFSFEGYQGAHGI